MDELQKSIREWLDAKGRNGFDHFMIRQMGYTMKNKDDMNIRWSAYRTFLDRIHHKNLASDPTMKRWFGIGGYAVPGREMVFDICFALGLDAEGAEQFLVEGLREPSFQINDYQEIIYLYGFEHGLSQEECNEMAAEYEKELDLGVAFCQTHSTHELKQMYLAKRKLPKDGFLSWMKENISFFKGYSKTVLDYFQRYKRLILESVKEDAAICLESLLEDTEFNSWKRRRFIKETNLETIRRFIYSKKKIEPDLRTNILEMAQIAYSENDPNSLFIRELFTLDYETMLASAGSHKVLRMTEKRMSDLLGMAIQREKQMRAVGAASHLEKKKPEEECPDWIRLLVRELREDGEAAESLTVGQAYEWLQHYKKAQKRRCLLIQRGDLLPMIMYMTQKDYLKSNAYDMDEYNAAEVVKSFEEVANATLSGCNMALLNKEYDLDSLFYLCIQKSEMYSLSDVLDEIRIQQQQE